MDSEAILGPVPSPWKVLYQSDGVASGALTPRFLNSTTGKKSDEDPRLPSLPEEWERTHRRRAPDDPSTFREFRNKKTGELIPHDPRLSVETLTERGILLETFNLV